ncbi:C-GCAxxG-C-C family protein [Methanonatronarchaeum sp. AMET6-2]|uniref:C-GCAxxG-C-C family protein n=1 Tax=Methanonatronarchaeum sp. AMET6-2 TaxID=2933293 RepID=UPI0011F6D8ED|nr:C-GCAxxG-C-C family protein [Methanonatronarchaeum sp. AMET6-2]RZN61907.1 MAG: C_GCAxxG_C_C family protein [Methanonatronarchaeia archaeon]UOY10637.1 C-GCAxxG-C-C family protein [Methanonatronarchaeum sp. AMET6-2]
MKLIDYGISKKIDTSKKQQLIEKAEEKARKKYMKGYNCAESVFETTIEILEEETGQRTGLPNNVVKIATGFGEGVGKYGSMCGALSGGTMALSILHGFKSPSMATKRERVGDKGVYKVFNQLPASFEEEFGSTICYELTREFNEIYNKAHIMKCQEITSKTAGMVIEIIIEKQNKENDEFDFKKTI